MDTHSPSQRSWNMSRIRSKDTTPEMHVRSALHRAGYRFRLHVKNLPGHPDIVLPKYKTVIEVRGCFWHRHKNCPYATTPTSHVDFWTKKFKDNVERDKKNEMLIKNSGWNYIIVWTCQIKNSTFLEQLIKKIPQTYSKTRKVSS